MQPKDMKTIRRGEIYSYDFGITEGSIQSGRRPVLVIQADNFNEKAPRVDFFRHNILRLLSFPDWVAHNCFQSAHITFSRIAQIDFVMVSCIRNIQFVPIRFHIVVH